jgi:hypothetical protein
MSRLLPRRRGKTEYLATLAALLVLVSACSAGSPRSAATDPGRQPEAVRPEGLQKRIGVAPFQVLTQHTDPYSRKLMRSYVLSAIRSECPGVVFVDPADKAYPPVLRSLPRLESGDLDNLQAAITGRQLGLNAVMVGTLTSVGMEEKDWGFWLLKQTRHFVRVQVLLEIYDTETATKLVDETADGRVRIDAADAEMIERKDNIDSGFVEEVLEIVAEDLGEDICEAIEDQDWKSFVLSAGPEEVWIAAGSQSGLEPGRVLEVFDSNTILEGFGGHRYFKPGPKIAEVKLVEVEPRRSKAVVVTGGDIQQLSTVKAKD